jgi:hypothetical protein
MIWVVKKRIDAYFASISPVLNGTFTSTAGKHELWANLRGFGALADGFQP